MTPIYDIIKAANSNHYLYFELNIPGITPLLWRVECVCVYGGGGWGGKAPYMVKQIKMKQIITFIMKFSTTHKIRIVNAQLQ